MKLSISNIAWEESEDEAVYEMMGRYGYSGLEIAPTRIFPVAPYGKLTEALHWRSELEREYGFLISSMQSIWYGKQERLFGSSEEREILLDYTKKAIDFASVINCRNIVFGCPRNRNIPEGIAVDSIVPFFRELGEYAFTKGTVIGLEANPTIYNTNFINDTMSAIRFIQEVNSMGFRLNLDVGTMLANGETISVLTNNVMYINHVHISEPGLKAIEKRSLHLQLSNLLREECYLGYISIEMGKMREILELESIMRYISEVFGGGECG